MKMNKTRKCELKRHTARAEQPCVVGGGYLYHGTTPIMGELMPIMEKGCPYPGWWVPISWPGSTSVAIGLPPK